MAFRPFPRELTPFEECKVMLLGRKWTPAEAAELIQLVRWGESARNNSTET